MKVITIGVLAFFALVADAIAADKYQIIPLDALERASPPIITQFHSALVFNLQTGEVVYCYASYLAGPVPGGSVNPGSCQKDKVPVGTMPPGPATLSDYRHPKTARYPAIWKVDQSTGVMTFCGRGAEQPLLSSDWYCETIAMPP